MKRTIFRTGVVTVLTVFATSAFTLVLASDEAPSDVQQDLRPFYNVYPLQPKLAHIPADHPVLQMEFPFFAPQEVDGYECEVTTTSAEGAPVLSQTYGLATDGKIDIDLTGQPLDAGSITVRIRSKVGGQVICEAQYPIRITEPAKAHSGKVERLNTMVSVLLRADLSPGDDETAYSFFNPRDDGWVFLAMTPESNAAMEALQVAIDGNEIAMTRNPTARTWETMRRLSQGEHALTIRGANCSGKLTINSVPEIINYPLCANSYIKGNPPYDWEFHKRHIFPACNTFTGAKVPPARAEEFKRLGLRSFVNIGGLYTVLAKEGPGSVAKRISEHPAMADPDVDGVTIDEFYMRPNLLESLSKYAKELRRVDNPQNKPIYTWIVNYPTVKGVHSDVISAIMNAAGGKGKLLYEAYCKPVATEAEVDPLLQEFLVEQVKAYDAFFPNATADIGIIFGNFVQGPNYRLDSRPHVDYKYFLDRQFYVLANNAEVANVPTLGFWGSYYCDEETLRWAFAVMRHYAVEGNTDMLSDRYGYRYIPGFLKNCDFEEGLDHWTVTKAQEGSVRADTLKGFGKTHEYRWCAGDTGDTVCAMRRAASQPNTVRQVAAGLEKGKLYSLQVMVADRADIQKPTGKPQRLAFAVDLGDAEIVESYVHVDKRYVNMYRIVFRAKSEKMEVRFSDWGSSEQAGGPVGQELIFNFVQLKPYFAK